MAKSMQERLAEIERSSREVARQAWERQRARKLGRSQPEVHPFKPGAQVISARYGQGEVVLSTPVQISVRYIETGRTVDYLVSTLLQTEELSLASAGTGTAPARPTTHGQMPLGAFIEKIYNEASAHADPDEQSSIFYEVVPEKAPPTVPQSVPLIQKLQRAYRECKIEKFYSHQIRAREALLAGKSVVLCTPTASGKTDAFNPTILETLLKEPQTTALYLFPLVALSADQRKKLRRLNQALPSNRQLVIGISDSTVPTAQKQVTKRANNRILITTPDSLHYVFLPNRYPNWCRFFRNLRFVVLDEAHVYKGVFGANVANSLRRLFIRCRADGNPRDPQMVICSATIRNPEVLATRVTGFPASVFEVIQESGAPQPARYRLALYGRATDICYQLLDAYSEGSRGLRPARTIVFCRSIRRVKSLATALRAKLTREARQNLASQIAYYYSGRGERAQVFESLVQGKIRMIVTTNALMAGIDVGDLDICVVEGFPGLVMDVRQMFGRVGRRSVGVSIFLGRRDDVFDQYYMEHPRQLFSGDPESAVLNPANPYIQTAHFKCATHVGAKTWDQEGPLPGTLLHYFGEDIDGIAADFIKQGLVTVQEGQFIGHFESPHDTPPLHDIRGGGEREYVIFDEQGRELERKREWYAFRDAHPNAILEISGRLYRVKTLNRDTREIRCQSIPSSEVRTRGTFDNKLVVDKLSSTRKEPGYELKLGRVTVVNTITGYIEYRIVMERVCPHRRCGYTTRDTEQTRCPNCGGRLRLRQIDEFISSHKLLVEPPLSVSLTTIAAWFELKQPITETYEHTFWPRWIVTPSDPNVVPSPEPSFTSAMHAAQHALRKVFPEVVICDPNDIDGLHLQEPSQLPKLYLYDRFSEGLGLAEELFDAPKPFLTKALERIESCNCLDDEGCPVCLAVYQCREFNRGLTKLGARYILRKLLGVPVDPVLSDLRNYVKTNVPHTAVVRKPATNQTQHSRNR